MELIDALDLEKAGENRYVGRNIGGGEGVVFGGQIMAQTIVAAARTVPEKEVKSAHVVFARGATGSAPLDIEVEPMHAGRAFASVTVTVRQTDRLCTRALVLLNAPEPDLIRFGAPAPAVERPDDVAPSGAHDPAWEFRIPGNVDVSDPAAVGPPELKVWSRFAGGPFDLTTSQALLAFASDGFLIGTAMRPHPGVGQALAHVSISTSVITHTLSFHEPFDAGRWVLLAHESPYAGRGRSYGRADAFDEDGRLVASFVQENMIRDYPEGQRPAAGTTARY